MIEVEELAVTVTTRNIAAITATVAMVAESATIHRAVATTREVVQQIKLSAQQNR